MCEPELGFRGTPVRIGVTHLSLERPLRAPQIQRIAEIIAGGDVPTILAGDFNVAKNDELRLLTEGGLQRANTGPTFPSWAPTKTLGHLFFSARFEILRSWTFSRCLFADHLPLIGEVRLA